MSAATDRRRALLTAALGFLQVAPRRPALHALHSWLDSWAGIGHVVVGMERYGFQLSLKKYGNSALPRGGGMGLPGGRRAHHDPTREGLPAPDIAVR